MRAIDLYAGIGGWSLGLRLAGVEVVASYEWWRPAIDTHNGNHCGQIKPIDIRQLVLDSLPPDIDFVVGSPPCTEFSYSNRGGSGNLAEGMKDLVRFFEVVDHLKPRFWAMENVPRVAEVLERAFIDPEHPLYRFRHLNARIEVIDFSEFGTPQARRRCIATNLSFEAVRALQPKVPRRTLGDVVGALAAPEVITDPIWGVDLPAHLLTETQMEPPLNLEEQRMNREAKLYHPVYNNMAFPDPLDVPARTVTATCTRVSRESIVIADPKTPGRFRRLNIRERASLQGFPITYQFYARSFSEKAKMIGNAIPPTFTHLLALVAQGVTADRFEGFTSAGRTLVAPSQPAPVTPPDQEGRTYPVSRSFRAALPHLRFKSGMRFELSNDIIGQKPEWRVRFFFGPSKDIRELDLDGSVTDDLRDNEPIREIVQSVAAEMRQAEQGLLNTTPDRLQLAWAHRTEGEGPFSVTDRLGSLAERLHNQLDASLGQEERSTIGDYIVAVAVAAAADKRLVSELKLRKYATWILAGIIVGEWFNTLTWHQDRRAAA